MAKQKPGFGLDAHQGLVFPSVGGVAGIFELFLL
jgi:hypothetical protein